MSNAKSDQHGAHLTTMFAQDVTLTSHPITYSQRRQRLSTVGTYEAVPHPPFQAVRVENVSTWRHHVQSPLQHHARAPDAHHGALVCARGHHRHLDIHSADTAIEDLLALVLGLACTLAASLAFDSVLRR